MSTENLKEKLVRFEKRLHDHSTRHSRQSLIQLLHPQFKEIGYSGRAYDFEQIIADLASEGPPVHKVISKQYELTRLDDDICSVSYLSAREQQDGSICRYARRTSIWKWEQSNWLLIFHQATPVSCKGWEAE